MGIRNGSGIRIVRPTAGNVSVISKNGDGYEFPQLTTATLMAAFEMCPTPTNLRRLGEFIMHNAGIKSDDFMMSNGTAALNMNLDPDITIRMSYHVKPGEKPLLLIQMLQFGQYIYEGDSFVQDGKVKENGQPSGIILAHRLFGLFS